MDGRRWAPPRGGLDGKAVTGYQIKIERTADHYCPIHWSAYHDDELLKDGSTETLFFAKRQAKRVCRQHKKGFIQTMRFEP